MNVSANHPRFRSLSIRENLTRAAEQGIVASQGLIAHGRGEAFDYLIGERTSRPAFTAISAAAAMLLSAIHPVVSVNGNTAALVGEEIVRLSSELDAPIEVNLFHRTLSRERRIVRYLEGFGAAEFLGIGKEASTIIPRVSSPRKRTDPRGIGTADVVLIPLEDGDRAEALKLAGKKVIAIDLNPLSRTSQTASISIVDNIVRTVPTLIKSVAQMKLMSRSELENMLSKFNNVQNLSLAISEMIRYLKGWSR